MSSNRPAAPRPADPSSTGGRRPGHRFLRFWTLVGVVVCLAAASATAVSVAVIAELVPAGVPERSRAQFTVPAAATRTPWTLASHDTSQLRTPGDVRIVRDTGTTIDVTWTDPSGGTRPTIVFLAQDEAPASVAATVQVAATRRQLTGLDPKARRYCIGVAVAYSPTVIVRAADVCTSRASASPIQPSAVRRSVVRGATAGPFL